MSCTGTHVAMRVELWEHEGHFLFLKNQFVNIRLLFQLLCFRVLYSSAKESRGNVRGLGEVLPACSHLPLRLVVCCLSDRCSMPFSPGSCMKSGERWTMVLYGWCASQFVCLLVNRSAGQSVPRDEDGCVPGRPARRSEVRLTNPYPSLTGKYKPKGHCQNASHAGCMM